MYISKLKRAFAQDYFQNVKKKLCEQNRHYEQQTYQVISHCFDQSMLTNPRTLDLPGNSAATWPP